MCLTKIAMRWIFLSKIKKNKYLSQRERERERERERWKNDMFFVVFIAIYIGVLWSFYHI